MKLTKGKKIALAAFAVFLAFMAVCTVVAKGIYASKLPRVSTSKPYSGSLTHVIEADAVVRQGQEYGIYTEPGLRVDTVSVSRGDIFNPGDALFRIETEDLEDLIAQRRLEIAKLKVQQAEALKVSSHDKKEQQSDTARAKEDYQKKLQDADAQILKCEQELEAAQRELALYDQYLAESAEAAEKADTENQGGNQPSGGTDSKPPEGSDGENQPSQPSGGTENKPPEGSDGGNQPSQPSGGTDSKPPEGSDGGNQPSQPSGGTESKPPEGSDGGNQPSQPSGGTENEPPEGSDGGNQPSQPSEGTESKPPEGSDGGNQPSQPSEGTESKPPEGSDGGNQPSQPSEGTESKPSEGSDGGNQPSQPSEGTESKPPEESEGENQPSEGEGTQPSEETGSEPQPSEGNESASQSSEEEGGAGMPSEESGADSGSLNEVVAQVPDYEQRYSQQEKRLQLEQKISACEQALEEAKRRKETELLAAARLIEDAASALDPDVSSVNLLSLDITYQEERLKRLEALLEADGWVYAQQSGRVVECCLSAGERVPDSAGILYALDDGERVLSAVFSEEASKYISVGTVFEAKMTMPDGSRVTGTAIVEDQEKEAEGSSSAKLSFEGLEAVIGQSMQLSYRMQTDTYATCISRASLYQESENTYYVFIAEEREGILGTEWKVRKINVTLLDQTDSAAAIQSVDISSDSRIVSSTTLPLMDGATVRVIQ